MNEENKSNARKAKIPIEKVRQIKRHLEKAAAIANQYNCQIFSSPEMAGLYHGDRMFDEKKGGGVNHDFFILDVNGPFDGGDF